jgi:hypothetical protein
MLRGDCAFARVPFFFEPNLDAVVKPLDAALRMQAEDTNFLRPREKKIIEPNYEPIRYGELLTRKNGGDFTLGDGK